MNVIKETFASDPEFVSSLDKACATIVNMKYGNCLSAKAPELVFVIEFVFVLYYKIVLFSLRIIVIVYYVNHPKQRRIVKSKKNYLVQ
jgi:hypothetical protein